MMSARAYRWPRFFAVLSRAFCTQDGALAVGYLVDYWSHPRSMDSSHGLIVAIVVGILVLAVVVDVAIKIVKRSHTQSSAAQQVKAFSNPAYDLDMSVDAEEHINNGTAPEQQPVDSEA